jgi:hypothetical protein
MKKHLNIPSRRLWAGVIVCLIIGLMIAGCRRREPEVIDVPTLAVLPSATPTSTFTRTPFPTWTFTYTPSLTPSLTPSNTLTPSLTWTRSYTHTLTYTPTYTYTLTYTLTPTRTYTPSNTVFPTLTPSNTWTPSHTPTDTPSPTRPTRFPTLIRATETVFGGASPTATVAAGPTIQFFTANAASVLSNTPVLLSWGSDGDSAIIEQINPGGAVLQSIQVGPTGQYSILPTTTGGTGNQAIFRLVVTKNGVTANSTPVTVGIACSATWFFGNQYAPPGTGCPAAVGATGSGAFQRFERGFMIYTNANGVNRICAAQDGGLYVCSTNGWDGSTINTSAAPSGRFIPGQMFNWMYYNTLGIGGTWNALLGWGIMDVAPGSRTLQYEGTVGGNNPFYLDTADGAVIRFSGGDSGTWTRIR